MIFPDLWKVSFIMKRRRTRLLAGRAHAAFVLGLHGLYFVDDADNTLNLLRRH